MHKSQQPAVRAERVAHRAAVARLRTVYRWLSEFHPSAERQATENAANNATKEQEAQP